MSSTNGDPLAPLAGLANPSESRQGEVISSAVVCFALAALFVAARFYTRTKIIHVIGWEDWTILASLVFSLGNTICFIIEGVVAEGKHFITVPPESLLIWGKAGWAAILIYGLSLWLTKMSILLLFLRILTYHYARRATQAMIAIVVLSHLWVVATVVTTCIPLDAFWDPTVKPTYCHPQQVWWANTGLNIATDFLIFVIPLPVIWQLQMPARQKILLLVLFALGFFVCLISVLRIIFLSEVIYSTDPTWDFVSIAIWTNVEVNIAIILACLPTLKPLLSRLFPALFDHSSHAGYQPQSSSDRSRPLTVGSRPSRPQMRQETGAHSKHNSLQLFGGGADGVAAAPETKGADPNHGIIPEEPQQQVDFSMKAMKRPADHDLEAQREGHDIEVGVAISQPPRALLGVTPSKSFASTNTSSNRTMDLGPEVRAESIGSGKN